MAQIANRPPSKLRSYRWQEISLFVLPIALMLLAMTQLLLVILVVKNEPNAKVDLQHVPILQGLTPIFGFIAALVVVHILLSIRFRKADQMILPLVGLLSGLGVLIATRLGPSAAGDPNLGNKQLLWVVLGLAICMGIIFGLRDIRWLSRYKYIVASVGIMLFCMTLAGALGADPNAPTRDQLRLGPFAFQPSELFKVCIVSFFAAYLSENRDVLAEGSWYLGKLKLPPLRQLGPLVLMLGIGLVLFLFVRDLGLALLTYSIFLSMIYFSTGKLSLVLTSLVVAIGLGYVGYSLLGYVRARFGVVGFDCITIPSDQAQREAYEALVSGPYLQVCQGLTAVSSGGIIGAGFGLGHPGFVPVVQSDMVLAAFGEELGLVGVFAILGLYLLVVYRGFHIAIEATDTFSQLLAAGLTSIFAIQTLIISAGNLKLMPLTGIPLPFLSYGGSSIIGNFIIIGILLRISYNTRVEREGMA
jgi:cell division protein FtsW (lipid II flippase)